MTEAFVSFNYFRRRSLYHLRFAKRGHESRKLRYLPRLARAQPCDCMQRIRAVESRTDCYERITASRTRRRLDGSHGVRDGG